MEKHNLKDFIKGWFIGNFFPTLFSSNDFEICVKRYKNGEVENRHTHKVATEYTIVGIGRIKMNGVEYAEDDIIVVEPGESSNFESITDSVLFIVKIPCVKGDKYNDID